MDIYNQMVLNNSESLSQAKEHIEDHLFAYDKYGAVLDGLFSKFDTMPKHFDKFLEKLVKITYRISNFFLNIFEI